MTIATSPDTQPLLLDVSNTTLHVTPEQSPMSVSCENILPGLVLSMDDIL